MAPRQMLAPGEYGQISSRRTSKPMTAAKARHVTDPARNKAIENARAWRARGEWVADCWYRNPQSGARQQIRRFARTETEARRSVEDEIARRSNQVTSQFTRSSTVADLANWWANEIAPLKSIRPQSLTKEQLLVERFIIPRVGSFRISEVNAYRAQSFLDDLRREGFLDRPKKARNVLRQIWHAAHIRGVVDTNIWDATKTPSRPQKKRSDIIALDEAQLLDVRAAVVEWTTRERSGPPPGRHLLDVLDLLAYTGGRVGEILALRVRDVAEDELGYGQLSLFGTIIPSGGIHVRQNEPKTETSRAIQPVPPYAVPMLRRLTEGKKQDDLLFLTRDGNPVGPNQIATQLRRAVRGTEWENVIHPHAFRSSIGTLVALKLGDEAARDFLRHSSVDITRSSYLRQDARTVDHATAEAIARGVLLTEEARSWAAALERTRITPGLEGFHVRQTANLERSENIF